MAEIILTPQQLAVLRAQQASLDKTAQNGAPMAGQQTQPAQPQAQQPAQPAGQEVNITPQGSGLFGGAKSAAEKAAQNDADRRSVFGDMKSEGNLPMLGLMFGLNMLANSGTQDFGSAIGKAGVDSITSYNAWLKQKEEAKRLRAQEQRAQEEHKLNMDKGNLELKASQREEDSIQRFMAGDRSPEVMMGSKDLRQHMFAMEIQKIQQETSLATARIGAGATLGAARINADAAMARVQEKARLDMEAARQKYELDEKSADAAMKRENQKEQYKAGLTAERDRVLHGYDMEKQDSQNKFTAGESALDRGHKQHMQGAEQQFTAGQNDKDRSLKWRMQDASQQFTAGQNEATRRHEDAKTQHAEDVKKQEQALTLIGMGYNPDQVYATLGIKPPTTSLVQGGAGQTPSAPQPQQGEKTGAGTGPLAPPSAQGVQIPPQGNDQKPLAPLAATPQGRAVISVLGGDYGKNAASALNEADKIAAQQKQAEAKATEANLKKQAAEEKQVQAQAQAKQKAVAVVQAIDDIDKIIGNKDNGLGKKGAAIRALPDFFSAGSAAKTIEAQLETIKSGISLQTLQAMREASPTGGALGSVTEGEHRLLASAIASLDLNMNPTAFKRNLGRIKSIYMDVINGTSNAIVRTEDGGVYLRDAHQKSGGGGAGGAPQKTLTPEQQKRAEFLKRKFNL